MTLVEGADYFIRVVNLPPRCGGVVSPNPDGTFNIYINARKDVDAQLEAYIHEYEHIADDDFYNGAPLHEIEK